MRTGLSAAEGRRGMAPSLMLIEAESCDSGLKHSLQFWECDRSDTEDKGEIQYQVSLVRLAMDVTTPVLIIHLASVIRRLLTFPTLCLLLLFFRRFYWISR